MRRLIYWCLTKADDFFGGRLHGLCDLRHWIEYRWPDVMEG